MEGIAVSLPGLSGVSWEVLAQDLNSNTSSERHDWQFSLAILSDVALGIHLAGQHR